MQVVASPRNKAVDLYLLQNLVATNPLCQLWTARHKVLKKDFLLKKINIKAPRFPEQNSQSSSSPAYQLGKKQASLLNLLKSEGVPRCHKLIRTSISVYLVYDSLSGCSLNAFLSERRPHPHETIRLMTSIASKLAQFQELGVIFGVLSLSDIFVSESGDINFADWILASMKDAISPIDQQIMKLYSTLPSYLVKSGSPSFASDVYCLGKIFNQIVETNSKMLQSSICAQLKDLIVEMTPERQFQAVKIVTVVKSLQNIGQALSPGELLSPTTPTFNLKFKLIRSNDIESTIARLKLKRTGSGTLGTIPLKVMGLSQPKIKNEWSEKDEKSRFKNRTTHSRQRSMSGLVEMSQLELIGKTILKRRGLAFFFMSLSEFMQGLSPEISFMLLKKARISLKSALTQSDKLREQHQSSFQIISALMASQLSRIEILLLKSQKNLFELNLVSEMKREFTNIHSMVNLKYLHLKTSQFLGHYARRGAVKGCSFEQKSEGYFQVYMLSKSMECGSYELFWDQTFRKESPTCNDGYFVSERQLGLRYFKSKVEAVLGKEI